MGGEERGKDPEPSASSSSSSGKKGAAAEEEVEDKVRVTVSRWEGMGWIK
jgi:hypothetical protein